MTTPMIKVRATRCPKAIPGTIFVLLCALAPTVLLAQGATCNGDLDAARDANQKALAADDKGDLGTANAFNSATQSALTAASVDCLSMNTFFQQMVQDASAQVAQIIALQNSLVTQSLSVKESMELQVDNLILNAKATE